MAPDEVLVPNASSALVTVVTVASLLILERVVVSTGFFTLGIWVAACLTNIKVAELAPSELLKPNAASALVTCVPVASLHIYERVVVSTGLTLRRLFCSFAIHAKIVVAAITSVQACAALQNLSTDIASESGMT